MNDIRQDNFWESKFGQVLRWLGILPCSLIGSILVCIIVIAMCLFGDIIDGSFWIYWNHPEMIYYEHFLTPFIVYGMFSIFFVKIGSCIAPRFPRQIAFVLAILIVMLFGIIGFIAVLASEWRFMIQCIVGIIAAAVTAFVTEDGIQDW